MVESIQTVLGGYMDTKKGIFYLQITILLFLSSSLFASDIYTKNDFLQSVSVAKEKLSGSWQNTDNSNECFSDIKINFNYSSTQTRIANGYGWSTFDNDDFNTGDYFDRIYSYHIGEKFLKKGDTISLSLVMLDNNVAILKIIEKHVLYKPKTMRIVSVIKSSIKTYRIENQDSNLYFQHYHETDSAQQPSQTKFCTYRKLDN